MQSQDEEEPTTKPLLDQELSQASNVSRSPSNASLPSKATLNSKQSPMTSKVPVYAVPASKLEKHPSKSSSATVKSVGSQASKIPYIEENKETVETPLNISPAESLPSKKLPIPGITAGSSSSQSSALLISDSKDKVSKSPSNESLHESISAKSNKSPIQSQVSLKSPAKDKSVGSKSSQSKDEDSIPSSIAPSTQSTPLGTNPEEVDGGFNKGPEEPRSKPVDKSNISELETDNAENEPSDTSNLQDFSSYYSSSSTEGSYQSIDPRDPNTKKVFFTNEVDKTVMQVTTNGPLKGFPYQENKVNTPQDENKEEINHQNKSIEDVLRQLGKDSLMKVSQPADCCQTSSFLNKKETNPDLPLSASLYSLPLDKNDLAYLAKTSGKPISYDGISVDKKKNTPVVEYEWETPRSSDPSNTRWLQAINDPQPSSSQQPDSVGGPLKKRKVSPKFCVYIEKLPPEELSTISENEPCNPLLPLDNTVKDNPKKRKRPSILKHCEIRYFTVELTEQASLKRNSQQNADDSSNRIDQTSLKGNGEIKMQKCSEENTNTFKLNAKQKSSSDSFHSCYSSESEINYDKTGHESIHSLNEANEQTCNKTIDELTMLSVIHLCDSEYKEKEVNLLWNPPCFKSSSSILHIQNVSSLASYKKDEKEIDDTYVKNLVLQDGIGKMEENSKKKSFIIVNGEKFDEQIHNDGSFTTLSDSITNAKETLDENKNKSQNQLKSVTEYDAKNKMNQLNNCSQHQIGYSTKNKLYTENNIETFSIHKNLNTAKKRSYTILSSLMLKRNDENIVLDTNTSNKPKNRITHCKQLIKEPNNKIEIFKKTQLGKQNRRQIIQVNKPNICKKEKRKPLLLANSRVKYIRSECRVSNLNLINPTFLLVENTLKIPQICYQVNNGIQIMIDITEGAPIVEGKLYGPLSENLNGKLVDKSLYDGSNFGMDKKYISVKNHSSLALDSNITLKSSLKLQNCWENTTNINLKSNKTATIKEETHNEGQNETMQIIPHISKIASNTKSKSDSKTSFFMDKEEFVLIDEYSKPLRLFNTNGRPLTDNSGRPLKTICGESLIIFDEGGIPLSDWENNPVCDSLGKFMDDADFNSETPWDSEILRSFTMDTGDPKMFYDVEGMPLTSVSGTMLLNASGVGLIRVNVAGKPVSDFRGRPLYDSNHKHC